MRTKILILEEKGLQPTRIIEAVGLESVVRDTFLVSHSETIRRAQNEEKGGG